MMNYPLTDEVESNLKQPLTISSVSQFVYEILSFNVTEPTKKTKPLLIILSSPAKNIQQPKAFTDSGPIFIFLSSWFTALYQPPASGPCSLPDPPTSHKAVL